MAYHLLTLRSKYGYGDDEMLEGYYANASGYVYNNQKLSAVSNDIANAQTPAHKRQYFVQKVREQTAKYRTLDPALRKNTPPSFGVERAGAFRDFQSPGSVLPTDNPLEVAISSELTNAFFAVQGTPEDGADTCYTRYGKFSLTPPDPNNGNVYLTLANRLALREDGTAIEVDPAAGPIHINPNGDVVQGDNTITRIPLYRMNRSPDPLNQQSADLQNLEARGSHLFAIHPAKGTETFPFLIAVDDDSRPLVPRAIEASNVSSAEKLSELMALNQSASANQYAMKAHLETTNKLLQSNRI